MLRRWRPAALIFVLGVVLVLSLSWTTLVGAVAEGAVVLALAWGVSPWFFPRPVSLADARRLSADDGAPVVFWRPGCQYCLRLRLRLGTAAGRLHWVDIWLDPEAAAELRERTGGDETVPTVIVGGKAHVNPDPRWVRRLAVHPPSSSLPWCLMRGYGRGIATIATRHDVILDVWFRDLSLESPPAAPLVLEREEDEERAVRFEVIETTIDLETGPQSAADAYLRLHLLSARLVRPRGLSVDGIFGQLQTVAWTDLGSVHPDDLPGLRERRRLAGRPLTVHAIDKFPRMTDFVSPPGVRISDVSRVRLGAHLAEGTVVMHEGLVNFNAGTLGPCMVEGRITQGSVVDAGADIGAGSSIMGTLSGGGTHISRIGKRCLLGANAGTGISLGDDSAVEAGLYVTRGTLVTLPDGRVVKAIELSGLSGVLFRRNSVTGTVEAVPWKSSTFTGLNDALHA